MVRQIKNSDKKLGPTRVVAYVRVSTEQQAAEGNSLEAQRSRLESYAQLFDLHIVAFEIDAGESASSLDRPGLQRALARLDGFDCEGLVVVKLDRLTRSVRDLCHLVDTYFRDGQCRLLSMSEHVDTSSASGRLVLNILTTVSQWEREAAAERTASVMRFLKEQGRFTGGWPPYGYTVDDDGNLVEHAIEQGVILRARSFRQAGMSLRAIAAALPPNRKGDVFDAKQIARML